MGILLIGEAKSYMQLQNWGCPNSILREALFLILLRSPALGIRLSEVQKSLKDLLFILDGFFHSSRVTMVVSGNCTEQKGIPVELLFLLDWVDSKCKDRRLETVADGCAGMTMDLIGCELIKPFTPRYRGVINRIARLGHFTLNALVDLVYASEKYSMLYQPKT